MQNDAGIRKCPSVYHYFLVLDLSFASSGLAAPSPEQRVHVLGWRGGQPGFVDRGVEVLEPFRILRILGW